MTQENKGIHQLSSAHDYRSASGRIRFTLTNDYMFKIIFQKTHILSGLLCALLGMEPEEIRSLEVTNPILAGATAADKTFILDINITLNNSAFINIELQVANQGNWPDRSLSYLCRSFDQLYHGEDYGSTKRALHIGILDFPLFPNRPEFYAAYRLMNVKDHQIFNDKFQLNVLELNEIHLATEEDRKRGLDQWAALFKAGTWREIKMLAAQDKSFDNIAQELYKANADDRIRRECEAREEFYFEQRRQQKRLEALKAEQRRQRQELESLKKDNSAKDQKISLQSQTISSQSQTISSQSQTISSQSQKISSQAAEIARLREKLSALGMDDD